MKKQSIKQKEVIITFCEGETEVKLFSFLKIQYSNKKIEFRGVENIGGFDTFAIFEKKYKKKIKKYDLKPKKDFASVKFLFIIDNDLIDSNKINSFLKTKGHLVQLCNPNTEGMILNIIGKKQIQVMGDKEFRKKCKDNFKNHFGCEAHHLKDISLKQIFNNINILKNNLPVLHDLFND